MEGTAAQSQSVWQHIPQVRIAASHIVDDIVHSSIVAVCIARDQNTRESVGTILRPSLDRYN